MERPLPNLHTPRNHYASTIRLPTEVLQDIFILCTRDYHYRYHQYSYPPVPTSVNISYVCRDWRNVALESPILWTYIFIRSQRWTEVLLARSKQASLKICADLSCLSRKHPGLKSVEMVMDHVERIQELSLDLCLPSSLISLVLSKLSSRAPRLQDLKVTIAYPPPPATDWPSPLFDGDPPALCTLELVNCLVPLNSFRLDALKVLRLDPVPDLCQQNIDKFLAALSSMQDLEELYLERALPTSTELLSDMAFKPFKMIDLIHLSRLWISAPLSTIVTLLSCINIPAETQIKLGCNFQPDPPSDCYTLLSSLLVQRYKDQILPSPILSLVILLNWCDVTLIFSRHPNETVSASYKKWDHKIPLAIRLDRLKMDEDAIIGDICSSMPLSSVQTLSINRPPFSPVFWRRILQQLQDVRCITLSDGNVPDLSALSHSDYITHNSGEDVQNHSGLLSGERGMLAPRLERLELRYIQFLPSHDSHLSEPAITFDCLFKTLSMRRLENSLGRLTMTRCTDSGSAMFDMVAVWGGRDGCYAISSRVYTSKEERLRS